MFIDPTGHWAEWIENAWSGVKRGTQLVFTAVQAPGNALRTFSMDLGNGNFADMPSNFIKSLTGEKQTSVMDLMLSSDQQADFYEFNAFLYQFSDLALGTLDPVELYGFFKAKQALSGAQSLYDDAITHGKTQGTKDGMSRVGRWMSKDEYNKMVQTGMVQ